MCEGLKGCMGSRIVRGRVGRASCIWDSLATAWDWGGQGFAPVHPKASASIKGVILKRMINPHTFIHHAWYTLLLYFSPLQVFKKINEGVMNVHYSWTLAWLQTVTPI
jgi:hypothetical protein